MIKHPNLCGSVGAARRRFHRESSISILALLGHDSGRLIDPDVAMQAAQAEGEMRAYVPAHDKGLDGDQPCRDGINTGPTWN